MAAAILPTIARPLASRVAAPAFRASARCSFARAAPKAWAAPRARSFGISAALQEKKYSNDHEWIEVSEDGKTGTIGITHYAAKSLGDVVYVELPSPDMDVNVGDSIGAVESVKSASDIMTPVSGVVVEANNALEETPATINKSPEDEGWIARIQLTEKAEEEINELLTPEEYLKFIEE